MAIYYCQLSLYLSLLKKIKATKPKLGRGINKKINIGILNIIKKQYPITYSK